MSHDLAISRTFSGCFSFLKGRRRVYFAGDRYERADAPYGYVKSPEDNHKLVVDEFASQIVKRIFKEFLSGKSMYKIAEGLNCDGIDTPGVYIAMQVGGEKQLARYRKKKPLWNNVAIGRILGNE